MKNDLLLTIPSVVQEYIHAGGLIVGSQAQNYIQNNSFIVGENQKSDWDILVPYTAWKDVKCLIPSSAIINKFKGFRFQKSKIDLDVWPDDLQRYFIQATRYKKEEVWALDILNDTIYSAKNRHLE